MICARNRATPTQKDTTAPRVKAPFQHEARLSSVSQVVPQPAQLSASQARLHTFNEGGKEKYDI